GSTCLTSQRDGYRGHQRGQRDQRRNRAPGLFPTTLAPAVGGATLSELMQRVRPQHAFLVRSEHRANPLQAIVQGDRRIDNENLDPLRRKPCEPPPQLCRLIRRDRHLSSSAALQHRVTRLQETENRRGTEWLREGGPSGLISKPVPRLLLSTPPAAVCRSPAVSSRKDSPAHG